MMPTILIIFRLFALGLAISLIWRLSSRRYTLTFTSKRSPLIEPNLSKIG